MDSSCWRGIRDLDAEVPVIIVTAYSRLEHADRGPAASAPRFLKKPFDMEELMLVVDKTLERSRLHRENRLLRRELQSERRQLGRSAARMRSNIPTTCRAGRRRALQRDHPWRIRDRQGTGRAGDPHLGPDPGHAVHRRRLWGAERYAAGVRVVRTRKAPLPVRLR